MLYITKEILNEILKQCQHDYPKEACGILTGKIMDTGEEPERLVKKLYKMKNVSDSPRTCYFMNPEEQFKVMKDMRNNGMELVAIYHSHTDTEAYPSKRDCELAFYPEAAYVIISLEHFENPVIRAFTIKENNIQEEKVIVRKNVLFICVENSCRSQIAEGIANTLFWRKICAYSAGSSPADKVNPLAIDVMKEIDIDISANKSKGFDKISGMEFDYVISMGCEVECPRIEATQFIEWNIENPVSRDIEFYRYIREKIYKNLKEFVEAL